MVLRLPDSWSNWNLEMLVFGERGKPEYPEKNLSHPGKEPTTNSTHMPAPGFEPGPHWWETTTAPPLQPKIRFNMAQNNSVKTTLHDGYCGVTFQNVAKQTLDILDVMTLQDGADLESTNTQRVISISTVLLNLPTI